MKRRSILIIISIIIILSALISSCELRAPSSTDDTSQANGNDSSTRIAELEAQIIALMQSQQLSDAERRREIAALEAQIKALKESSSTAPPVSDSGVSTDEPLQSFKYSIENGKAVITQITAKEESVTVPATIDGYAVSTIGSNALSSSSVRSVIVSSGIEKLDWFAFSGCVSLSSVTLPDSISAIGYGAFDNTSSSLTIHCSRDSFAQKYAQSYGITYNIT